MAYQLLKPNEALAKVTCNSIKYNDLPRRTFSKQNAIASHLQSCFKVGYFGCFDVGFVVWNISEWQNWITTSLNPMKDSWALLTSKSETAKPTFTPINPLHASLHLILTSQLLNPPTHHFVPCINITCYLCSNLLCFASLLSEWNENSQVHRLAYYKLCASI